MHSNIHLTRNISIKISHLMKFACIVILSLIVIGFNACFEKEPTPPQTIEITKSCSTPRYTVVMGKLESSGKNVLPKDAFKALLDKALMDTGCFRIESKPSKDSWTLDVTYTFEVQETKEDTSVISTKDNVVLKSDVHFHLFNKTQTIQQSATSTLKLSEKKYLGMGDELQITQEQKENVVKRSFRTIFSNLFNLPES